MRKKSSKSAQTSQTKIALGADACMLESAFVYALADSGQAGVENMLDIFKKERCNGQNSWHKVA
ncbi:alpha-hydroxy-acid oxidizing protein [Ursidibacter maritimus]|uniref:Alpha-hydroxy-acid oxidizing protein n=1 Tax=Ursidibacter maritimus TaxID=1331689 RepID=A0A949T766_9PAST|nr:hypothetical protein A1D26_08300 [Ursidibacter maritimus]MBV6524269.1 alpha-hydroxy-acid oxidizing protein [Ursidibacter maritimus]MBV6526536.1 alpha-hydroxy-acid oxidizing protein [Ursidibacter maritimus]MBV6528404.1 alpha-hydroxy-acid oxidizing protein [Ursidibacter maritimus]MBV6530287.1 alpha-hydroxy-acid oxidizing protein [Ursidibacter maritimus]